MVGSSLSMSFLTTTVFVNLLLSVSTEYAPPTNPISTLTNTFIVDVCDGYPESCNTLCTAASTWIGFTGPVVPCLCCHYYGAIQTPTMSPTQAPTSSPTYIYLGKFVSVVFERPEDRRRETRIARSHEDPYTGVDNAAFLKFEVDFGTITGLTLGFDYTICETCVNDNCVRETTERRAERGSRAPTAAPINVGRRFRRRFEDSNDNVETKTAPPTPPTPLVDTIIDRRQANDEDHFPVIKFNVLLTESASQAEAVIKIEGEQDFDLTLTREDDSTIETSATEVDQFEAMIPGTGPRCTPRFTNMDDDTAFDARIDNLCGGSAPNTPRYGSDAILCNGQNTNNQKEAFTQRLKRSTANGLFGSRDVSRDCGAYCVYDIEDPTLSYRWDGGRRKCWRFKGNKRCYKDNADEREYAQTRQADLCPASPPV